MATPAPVEYYRDFYGCTAVLRHLDDGLWYLTVTNPYGIHICRRRPFMTHKGARIALGKMSDGTMKLVPQKEGDRQ